MQAVLLPSSQASFSLAEDWEVLISDRFPENLNIFADIIGIDRIELGSMRGTFPLEKGFQSSLTIPKGTVLSVEGFVSKKTQRHREKFVFSFPYAHPENGTVKIYRMAVNPLDCPPLICNGIDTNDGSTIRERSMLRRLRSRLSWWHSGDNLEDMKKSFLSEIDAAYSSDVLNLEAKKRLEAELEKYDMAKISKMEFRRQKTRNTNVIQGCLWWFRSVSDVAGPRTTESWREKLRSNLLEAKKLRSSRQYRELLRRLKIQEEIALFEEELPTKEDKKRASAPQE